MAKINDDTLAGLILLAYSLVHIFYLTPDQVELHLHDTVLVMSPRFFCYVTAGILAILSAVLIFLSLRPKGQKAAAEAPVTSWKPFMRGMFCTALSCAYVLLASILGFFASTALAMVAFLLYFGVRDWLGILIFLVIILGSIYLFFVQALKVVMPEGLLY